MEFIDLDHLIKNPPEPVGSLWGDDKISLIPRKGLVLLHASSKTGKSQKSMNIAIAGALGLPSYLGIKMNGPFTTLVNQGEINIRGVYERAAKMLENIPGREAGPTQEELQRIHINKERISRLSEDAAFIEFQDHVRRLAPDLIILDPLAHVLTTNENDNAVVGAVLEKLATLRDDPGCAILLIHHDAKVSESTAMRSPQQRARGADRLNADPDCILSLVAGVRLPTGPTGTLHVASRYGRSVHPMSLKLNEDTLWFEENIEIGNPKQIALWISESEYAIVREDWLVERIERGWDLHDPKQHRAALNYIKRAMDDGFIVLCDEVDDERFYRVKEEK